MIGYRTFRNWDPPALLQLFRQTRPGRAFACPDSVHALETAVFCLSYFDPQGLIIAEDDGQVIGFAHAGFGASDDRMRLDLTRGVICCVLVSHEYQHQGVGQELVRRAEEYLVAKGARTIHAGQSRFRDPFYLGVYGGARPSGFLESDQAARPFFESLGYTVLQKIRIFQRDVSDPKGPMNYKLISLKRQTELTLTDQPEHPTWWWLCRYGNIESMRFNLISRLTREPIATATVIGMDHYLNAWNERVVGLVDLVVEEKFRNQGFGQTLIVETLRRLRSELITRAEIHIPQEYHDGIAAVEAAGFTEVDVGVVYHKPAAGE